MLENDGGHEIRGQTIENQSLLTIIQNLFYWNVYIPPTIVSTVQVGYASLIHCLGVNNVKYREIIKQYCATDGQVILHN